jgi:Leucine-rich repeat (LRR) protein
MKKDISNNEIKIISNNLNKLIIKELKISQCKLQGFPTTLIELTTLIKLNMVNNPEIKEIPNSIKSLTNLEEINVSRCEIDDITNLFLLKNLKILKASMNKIKEIKLEKDNLLSLNLKEIVLDKNKIINIPNEFSLLTNLEILNFSDNKIDIYQDELNNLKCIKYLNFSQNNINYLTDLKNYTCLNYLDFSFNSLKKFNCFMDNLFHLNFSNNKLFNFPNNIHFAKNLEFLNFYTNNITFIPDNFYFLFSKLKVFFYIFYKKIFKKKLKKGIKNFL